MADVVGTAFVRVKALTDNLGKDIKKNFEKGVSDAKLDRVASDKGEDLGERMGEGIADGTKKTLDKKAKSGDLISDNLFDGMRRDIRKAGAKLAEDLDWGERIKRSIDLQSDDVRKSLKKISDAGRIDTDFDLPFADDRKLKDRFQSAFKSINSGVKENIENFKKWRRTADSEGGGIGNVLENLASKLHNFGGGGGGGIGKLSGRAGIYGAIAGALLAALPIIQDVGSAILAYATGLLAQIGFIVTALGGLGIAAAGVLGSAFAAVGPIALAFKSETKALEEFSDSMKAVGEEFLLIGTTTQETLLPALDKAANKLTDLVPLFAEYGLFVGQAVGSFSLLAANTLTGAEAQERFGDILRSSLNVLDLLFPALLNVGDILSGVWVAAIPAIERFAGTLDTVFERWSDIVNTGLDDGSLTRTFDIWYDRAETLGSALGNLSGALFDILQVGADSSDNVFDRFDEWAEGYREWTSSEVGQNKLKLIFDNSLAVMREINGITADLFDGIFGRLADVGGVDGTVEALQRFRDILPDLQEGFQDFLGATESLTSAIGPKIIEKIGETFEKLREPIGRLVFQILDLFEAMEESGAFETLLELLKILTETLRTLLSIPGFGTFIGYMLAFGTAAKIAALTLGPFVKVLGPFLAVMKGLAAANTITALSGTAAGMTAIGRAQTKKALADTSTGLSSVVRSLAVKGSGGVGGLLKGIAGSLGLMGPVGIAAGIAVGTVGYAFYRHKKDAAEFAQEVRQATEAIGTLNGGLNITTEGIANYIRETSRFETKNQLDDIAALGLTVESLAESIAKGTTEYAEFTDAALESGQLFAQVGDRYGGSSDFVKEQVDSLDELARKYNLTAKQQEALLNGDGVYTGANNEILISIEGNRSLLASYEELYKVIGQGAKDTFGEFASNAQNARLIGTGALNKIAEDLAGIGDDEPEEAIAVMSNALALLEVKALANIESFSGLSQATKDLAKEQSIRADGTLDAVKYEQLLYNEQQKLFNQVRDNLNLFHSNEFEKYFRDAKQEVKEFSRVFEGVDFEEFQFIGNFGGIDALLDSFPKAGDAAADLFDELRKLPKDEFNAAAQALNLDADSLKEAMTGAQQAIIDLQETALSKLPSIQEALDKSLKTKEDGTQYFDTKAFDKAATERINQTNQFGLDIAQIQEDRGDEAARIAIQQGPDTARALAEGLQVDAKGTNALLDKMEAAESALKTKVGELFRESVAAEYLAKTKPAGDAMAVGLTAALTEPSTFKALEEGGTALLNSMEHGFKGRFEIKDDVLRFIPFGKFTRTTQTLSNRTSTAGSGGGGFSFLSTGGFVPGAGFFGSGPSGTDTVPAWLTPGEFVLRRSVAQAIPSNVLKSLNAGDPALLRLLSAKNKGVGDLQSVLSGAGAGGTTSVVGAGQGSTFGQGSVVIYAQGTSAAEVYREFDHRTNWKLTSRGDK